MDIGTTLAKLAKHTDTLEQEYLKHTGWTVAPGLAGECHLWTRRVGEGDLTFPQGLAVTCQRWLDGLE